MKVTVEQVLAEPLEVEVNGRRFRVIAVEDDSDPTGKFIHLERLLVEDTPFAGSWLSEDFVSPLLAQLLIDRVVALCCAGRDDERERFEKWWCEKHRVSRDYLQPDGFGGTLGVQHQWEAWQAALAARD